MRCVERGEVGNQCCIFVVVVSVYITAGDGVKRYRGEYKVINIIATESSLNSSKYGENPDCHQLSPVRSRKHLLMVSFLFHKCLTINRRQEKPSDFYESDNNTLPSRFV